MKYYFHPWFRDKGCPECGRRTDESFHRPEMCKRFKESSETQTAGCASCYKPIPPGNRIVLELPGCGSYICKECDNLGKTMKIMKEFIKEIPEPPQPGFRYRFQD